MDYTNDLRLIGPLGHGGAGVIYRAALLNPQLKKQHNIEEVAVKQVTIWDKLTDEENLQRFHQEVSLLFSLIFHENIATLIGYTESPQTIITKMYRTDLTRFILNPEEHISPSLAISLAIDIINGLAAMHNIGIVHRDIKSANVLLV